MYDNYYWEKFVGVGGSINGEKALLLSIISFSTSILVFSS
jgi:hypothetical protein